MKRPFAEKRPLGPFIGSDVAGSVRQPDNPGLKFTPPSWHKIIHDTQDLREVPLENYPTLSFNELNPSTGGRLADKVFPFKTRNDLASKDFSEYGVVTPDNPSKELVQVNLHSKEFYGEKWLSATVTKLIESEDTSTNRGPIPATKFKLLRWQTDWPEAYTGPAIVVSIQSTVDTPIENVSFVANMLLKNAMGFAKKNHPSFYGGDRNISEIPKDEWQLEFKNISQTDNSVTMLVIFDLLTREEVVEKFKSEVDTSSSGSDSTDDGVSDATETALSI